MHETRRGARYLIGLVSAVIWTALILGLYYWAHKPITPGQAQVWGGAALDLAAAGACVALAGGIGRSLLRRLDLDAWSAPERSASAALIGLSVLSLLVAAVGAVLLNPFSMIALGGLVAAFTRRDLAAWLRETVTWARGGLPGGRWERFLALAALILAGMALGMALLPPIKWDVLTYHLAGPQAYVRHGRFYAVPHNHFLGFPQLVDTLYAGQLALTGRLTAAGPLHWLIGVLMLVMTGGYTARHAGRAAGWVAVNALLVSTTIWLEMTFAYVDLMLMGLVMVGLAAVEAWETAQEETPAAHWVGGRGAKFLLLLGAVAGFALGTKYTALWIGAGFGVLILWRSRGEGLPAILRRALLYGGVAALVMLPWLARNAIWYHNPLYPFFFDAHEMDHLRQDWYSQPGSGLVQTANAWQVPVMPLAAAIFGVEGSGIYGSDVGPLFAILISLLLLAWPRLAETERAVTRRALALAGVMTFGWMALAAFGSYINAQTRLVLYIFPPLAVAGGIALEALRRLPEKPLNLGFIMRALVVLVIVLALFSGVQAAITSGIHLYFAGGEDYQQAFLSYRLGWYAEAMRQVNALPAGTHVWFLWEPRTLYCEADRIDCRPDSLMDAWYYARRTVDAGDPAAIAAHWRAGGADYVLVYEFGRGFERDNNSLYHQADWAAWDVLVRDHLIEVWKGGNASDDIQYILYRWRE